MKLIALDVPDHDTPAPAIICATPEAVVAALAPGTLVLGAEALPPAAVVDRMHGVVFTFAAAPSEAWLELSRGRRCVLAGPEGPIHRWYPPLRTTPPRPQLEHVWVATDPPEDRDRIVRAVGDAGWTHDRTIADAVVDLRPAATHGRERLRDLARGALVVSNHAFAAELGLEENEDYARADNVEHTIELLEAALVSPRSVFPIRLRGRQKIEEVYSPRRAYSLLYTDASRLMRAGARA